MTHSDCLRDLYISISKATSDQESVISNHSDSDSLTFISDFSYSYDCKAGSSMQLVALWQDAAARFVFRSSDDQVSRQSAVLQHEQRRGRSTGCHRLTDWFTDHWLVSKCMLHAACWCCALQYPLRPCSFCKDQPPWKLLRQVQPPWKLLRQVLTAMRCLEC